MGRPGLDPSFPDIIADYRELGYCDDDIARRLGLTTETLHRRFDRLGIRRGRRWRDIEDARPDNVLTRSQIYGHRPAAPVTRPTCGSRCEALYGGPLCAQCGALRGDKVNSAGVKPSGPIASVVSPFGKGGP